MRDIIHLENPESGESIIAILSQGLGAVATVPIGVLSDRLQSGRKPFVYISCALLAGSNIALLFCREFESVLITASIAGLSNGAYLTMDTSLAMDTLPGTEEAARLLGVWGIAAFIGTALGPLVGGPLLFLTADSDGHYSLIGYSILFSLSSLSFGLSAGILNFVQRE